MFRVKTPLIAALIVAIVTGVGYVAVTSHLDEAVTKRVEASVRHAQAQIVRSTRLVSLDLATLAASFAREDEFRNVFTHTDEKSRREAAGVACDGHNGRLEKEHQKAGIIGVVDARGHLIARDLSYNWRYDEDLSKEYPSLAVALTQGLPNKDVWDIDGTMYRVGSAPIKNAAGQVIGGVFVGYVESAGDATEESERSGVDVAYFFESKGQMKIHASSFKRAEGASSESAEEKALAEQLFPAGGPASPAIEKHEETGLFRVRINNDEWVAAAAPMTGNIPTSTTKSGFVVLTSLSAARAATGVGMAGLVILGIGLVGLLAAVASAVMTARRFLQPLDRVYSGVSEVINGNHEYSWESPSPDFEGLANSLNVMLARLTGRPDPSDDDVPDEEGGGDGLFVDEAAAAGGAQAASAEEAAQLAAEPADAYYQRLFREYAQARQQTGEGTDGLDPQQFVAKLRENEAALAKKYGARMVRFKVVVKGNQTTLKPVPIQ